MSLQTKQELAAEIETNIVSTKMNGEVFNVGLSKANLNKKELAEAIT